MEEGRVAGRGSWRDSKSATKTGFGGDRDEMVRQTGREKTERQTQSQGRERQRRAHGERETDERHLNTQRDRVERVGQGRGKREEGGIQLWGEASIAASALCLL